MTHDWKLSDEEMARRYPALWRRHLKRRKKQPEPPKPAKRVRRFRRQGFHWTKEEDRLLRDGWGKMSLKQLSDLLERSARGISHRAKELELGPASKHGGAMSLREFARYSGFSRTKIRNAAKVLRIRFRRAKASYPYRRTTTGRVHQKSRTHSINEDEQMRLIEYLLEHDAFIFAKRRPRPTVSCGGCSKRRPHYAKGLCKTCYSREYARARRKK